MLLLSPRRWPRRPPGEARPARSPPASTARSPPSRPCAGWCAPPSCNGPGVAAASGWLEVKWSGSQTTGCLPPRPDFLCAWRTALSAAAAGGRPVRPGRLQACLHWGGAGLMSPVPGNCNPLIRAPDFCGAVGAGLAGAPGPVRRCGEVPRCGTSTRSRSQAVARPWRRSRGGAYGRPRQLQG